MVEKRWRMATKKGKGMRTFLRARLVPRPSPEPSAKFLSRSLSPLCPTPAPHPAEGWSQGENAERTTEMQQSGEGRLGVHATEKAGGALITVWKDTIARGPASPHGQPGHRVKEPCRWALASGR